MFVFRQVSNYLHQQQNNFYSLLRAISYFLPPSTYTPHTSPCTTSTLFASFGGLQPTPLPIFPSPKRQLSIFVTHLKPFLVQHCYRQPNFSVTPYLKSQMGDLNFPNCYSEPVIPSLVTTPFRPDFTSIIFKFRAHF